MSDYDPGPDAGGTAYPDVVAYPDVHVQLSGTDGNAFAVIGAVTKALRAAGVQAHHIDACRADMMSGDYDHLLRAAMAWVTVS